MRVQLVSNKVGIFCIVWYAVIIIIGTVVSTFLTGCTTTPWLSKPEHVGSTWKHQSDQYHNFLADSLECRYYTNAFVRDTQKIPVKPLQLGRDSAKPLKGTEPTYDECMQTRGYYK